MRAPIVWHKTGEASLALSVIACAINDYACQRGDDYYSAEMFLFSESRNWRQHRQIICDIAGVDVGFVQRAAKKLKGEAMKEEKKPDGIIDLGCCNGWEKRPDVVAACEHETESAEIGRCYYRVTCRKCGYTYTIDSSD